MFHFDTILRGEPGFGGYALCVALLALVAFIDFATGYELNVSILYLAPVFTTTWLFGSQAGVFVSVLAALSVVITGQTYSYSHQGYQIWEASIQFATFALFAMVIAKLKTAISHADERFATVLEGLEVAVNREHRLSGSREVRLQDLLRERIVTFADCDMADELLRSLQSAGQTASIAHQVATESDLQALLDANLGVAAIPQFAAQLENVHRLRVTGADMTRTVSVYTVFGRPRSAICATLLNLLRAAQWPSQKGPPMTTRSVRK